MKQFTPPYSANNQLVGETKRIASIDALRGIVLLGIFIIHASDCFGFAEYAGDGFYIKFVYFFLAHRFAPIFATLFGVSFYLILRKGNYPSIKFVWRCFLLIGFGLLNKLFYTYDALMWYGICGMFLVFFRNLSSKKLLILAILFYLIGLVISQFSLGDLLIPNHINDRYQSGTLAQVTSYPIFKSVQDYFFVQLNGTLGFGTISKFLFGYCLAKAGIIDNIAYYIGKIQIKHLLITAVFLSIPIILFYSIKRIFGVRVTLLTSLFNEFSFIFYAVIILFIYYKIQVKGWKYIEAYGRLGLTNYSVQSIFGMIIVTTIIIPNQLSPNHLLLIILLFYIFQCIFSYYWLKYFKYGPFEYIWRALTSLKFTNPLRQNV